MPVQIGFKFVTARVQQGSCDPALAQPAQIRNSGKPFHTTTPHQVQEQGLCLVISMVRGQVDVAALQYFANRLVAAIAGFFFGAGSADLLDFQIAAGEFNASFQTKIPAMLLPVIRAGVQAVVKMDGMNRSLQLSATFIQGVE